MKVELSPFDSVSVYDVMEPCVGSSPTPGTNPASGGGSARSWMRVCCPDSGGLLSREMHEVGDKIKRGGVPMPHPA